MQIETLEKSFAPGVFMHFNFLNYEYCYVKNVKHDWILDSNLPSNVTQSLIQCFIVQFYVLKSSNKQQMIIC